MGENRLMADLYEENQRLKERIKELEEKHFVECTIISQYDDELAKAKELLNKVPKVLDNLCFAVSESGGCEFCPYGKTNPDGACDVERLRSEIESWIESGTVCSQYVPCSGGDLCANDMGASSCTCNGNSKKCDYYLETEGDK